MFVKVSLISFGNTYIFLVSFQYLVVVVVRILIILKANCPWLKRICCFFIAWCWYPSRTNANDGTVLDTTVIIKYKSLAVQRIRRSTYKLLKHKYIIFEVEDL